VGTSASERDENILDTVLHEPPVRAELTTHSQDSKDIMKSARTCRVGVIGYGAIGVPVVAGITAGRVAGAVLVGIISRSPRLRSGRVLTCS
jgi:hypothetical protein